MPHVQTSTIALDSLQFGQGSDVVFSHGLAANQAFWYFRIAPEFAKEFRVTLYDLRGHGNSDAPASGYSTKDLAEDLRALMDARDIREAHLVGHSFGGAVSLHFAALYPDRVRSLAVLDSRLHALQPFNSPEDQSYWDDQHERMAARCHPVPPGTPRWLLPLLNELAGARENPQSAGMLPGAKPRNGIWDPTLRSSQRWLKLVRETSFLADLQSTAGLTPDVISAIDTPILLVYGEHSLMIKTLHELMRILPHAVTRVIEGAGHFFPLAQPDLVIDAVMPFIREPFKTP